MPPINLKTLDVVQGARLTRTLQGQDLDGTTPTVFLNTDTLTGTVWMAQNEPSVISFTPIWFNASLCQFTVQLTETQTAGLAIDAEYNLQVFATRSGTTYCIGWVLLQILPAAGNQAAASPPDLITGAYAARMLGQLNLSQAALEVIPDLVTGISGAVRGYCVRQFRSGTWVETVPVISGLIRLSQTPIQYMQRIECQPQIALTVSNTSADQAWVYCTASGDGLIGYTLLTMVLNWTSSGITNSTPLTISAGQTISTLASLINGVGSGWSAVADSILGDYPSAQMMDALNSRGAGINDQPDAGALFRVYTSIATNSRPYSDSGMETGMWEVGRIASGGLDARWGSDFGVWDNIPGGDDTGTVRATYQGGLTSVPPQIQVAVAELVKLELTRLGTDMLLKSEQAGEYNYVLNEAMVEAFPPYIKNPMNKFRITNA